MRVEYISSSGLPEPGIDGGGMFKEFFGELIKIAYKSEYGLFKETPNHEIYPNPHSQQLFPDDLNKFEFLGIAHSDILILKRQNTRKSNNGKYTSRASFC